MGLPSYRAGMRTYLVITPPSTRYAQLHALELRGLRGAMPLSGRLWKIPSDQLSSMCVDEAESCFDILEPLLRAVSFNALLTQLSHGAQSRPELRRPWTLRFDGHDTPRKEGSGRTTAQLTAVARYIPGPPALLHGTSPADTSDLVLLRTRRLWYLAHSRHAATRAALRRSEIDAWSARPYSFSAATDLSLAKLALSIAVQHHRAGGTVDPVVLDPCMGSGTVLFAAAQRGLRSVGADCNPIATAGARVNLADAATRLSWATGVAPVVIDHDCTTPIPPSIAGGVGIVLASLPWGREQRIPHHTYLRDLLWAVRASVPDDATYCCLSATPLVQTLSECGLVLIAQVEVGGAPGGPPRCYLSLSRAGEVAEGPLVESSERGGELGGGLPGGKKSPGGDEGEAAPTALLEGGGLRGEASRYGAPMVGEVIELQCRTNAGRRWIDARVLHSSAGDQPWQCSLEWLGEAVTASTVLPTDVSLARHGGPNWRRTG